MKKVKTKEEKVKMAERIMSAGLMILFAACIITYFVLIQGFRVNLLINFSLAYTVAIGIWMFVWVCIIDKFEGELE